MEYLLDLIYDIIAHPFRVEVEQLGLEQELTRMF